MAEKGFVVECLSETLCLPCVNKGVRKVAEFFCQECKEHLCSSCSNVHKMLPTLSSHVLMSANAAVSRTPKFDIQNLDKCQNHWELFKFLCEDEDMLCCSTCVIVSHRKCHSVVEIGNKANRTLSSLPFIKRDLVQMDSRLKGCIQRMGTRSDKLQKGTTKIMDSIQEMQDSVNEMFENFKRRVAKEISDFKANETKNAQVSRKRLYDCICEVKRCLADIDETLEQGTPAQQLIVSNHLRERVRQLREKTEKESNEIRDTVASFKFDDCLNLPPKTTLVPGNLTLKYNDKLKKRETNIQWNLLASIDLKPVEDDVGEPYYTGLDFLPDGRLICVDNKNKKCVIYNERLQRMGDIKVSYFPQDVVAVAIDRIAITCGTRYEINFYKVCDSSEIVAVRTVELSSKTIYASISRMDTKYFLVGTVLGQQPVRVVATSGEEKELELNFPAEIYDSACTYIANSQKIVVTDRYSNSVYIYDIASKIRTEVKQAELIKEPCGVAVGPGNCIFVCSKNTNSIVHISETGQILSSQVLNMEYPCSVCVSKDKTKLVVSNRALGKHKLHLFSIIESPTFQW